MGMLVRSICVLIPLILSGCLTPRAMQDADAARKMGYASLYDGDTPRALTFMKESAKKNKWDPENWQALALAYMDSGLSEDAERCFKEALEIQPNYPQVQLNLASLYLGEERWDDAITQLRLVLANKEYREPARAEHNLGWAYYNKGEYEVARKSYRQVLRQFPNFCPSLHNLGKVDEAEGKLPDALARYKQALVCNPGDLNVQLSLGILETRLDIVADACMHLQPIIEVDPFGELAERAKEYLDMLDCGKVTAR